MDPLSDVLALVTVDAAVTSRLDATGEWALRFAGVPHVKFGVVHAGELVVSTGERWVALTAGDCYLVTTGDGYLMASAPGVEPEDGGARFAASARDGHLRLGDGDPDVVVTGGRFVLDAQHAGLLLELLPPVLRIAGGSPALRALVDLLDAETAAGPRAGSDLVRTHLAHLVLVEALRVHSGAPDARGWLAALADPRIGPALRLLHADPARHWTVADLAAHVHLARSTFAALFRERVGAAPLDHLLRRRMHHAVTLLRGGDLSVHQVATALGYSSASAFSHAFKRVLGRPPTAFTRSRS